MRAYTHTNIPHAHEKLISALEEVVGSSKLHVYVDATTVDVQDAPVISADGHNVFVVPVSGVLYTSQSGVYALDADPNRWRNKW